MIAIAGEKHAADPQPGLAFRTATVEALAPEAPFDAVLGFNYLHLVRDLPGVLAGIHALLTPDGLFISKTPCVGDMNPLLGFALPAMRAIGQAPYAGVFRAAELRQRISAAGFEILAAENHASKGDDHRPYVVARKL
jgi:2-polyprenyl-3-methyl-5-hydroxy-6-metoxy-1,4-benzoquinol methylase